MAEQPRPPPIIPAGATATTMSWRLGLLLSVVGIVAITVLLVQLDGFYAAAYSADELDKKPISDVPRTNPRMLRGSEKIGEGLLLGPEDIVFDPNLRVIYTGCSDGWIKRVTVDDSVVEEWVNTGGRPLGLSLGYAGEVYVADADKVLATLDRKE